MNLVIYVTEAVINQCDKCFYFELRHGVLGIGDVSSGPLSGICGSDQRIAGLRIASLDKIVEFKHLS